MRKIIAEIAEVVIVGLSMGVIMAVLGIDIEFWQIVLVAIGATLVTGIASAIRKAIEKGGLAPIYDYQWTYQYNENTITVKAAKTEELYVNGTLVDSKKGIWLKSVELNGRLDSGEKIAAVLSGEKIKKAISTDKYMRCELLVDGKPLMEAMA